MIGRVFKFYTTHGLERGGVTYEKERARELLVQYEQAPKRAMARKARLSIIEMLWFLSDIGCVMR